MAKLIRETPAVDVFYKFMMSQGLEVPPATLMHP